MFTVGVIEVIFIISSRIFIETLLAIDEQVAIIVLDPNVVKYILKAIVPVFVDREVAPDILLPLLSESVTSLLPVYNWLDSVIKVTVIIKVK